MGTFTYVATNPSEQLITGKLQASSRGAAIEALHKQELHPISVKERSALQKSMNISIGGPPKVKSDVLVVFTRELSAMIGAGVPLLRAIDSLGDHTENVALKRILDEVAHDVQGGASLGDSLAKHPKTFSEVYVNMVRAGEAAGILDEILKRLAFQQEKNATIRKKVKSAMTYPVVLICITIIAFFGLMLFVIPKIGNILHSLAGPGAKLPALTRGMLSLSGFMTHWWFVIIPILAAVIFGVFRYIHTPQGKRQFHRLILKTPGVKTLIMKIAVARFARTFSALMGAGVPVLESLEVTARAVGNTVYEDAINEAGEAVKNGSNLSVVVEDNPLFPAIVSQMLAVGEETGQTDTVLVKVADFYEEEVDVAIDGLASIIEPVMIVFMGAAVGLLAASVMLPIAGLAQSIKS